MHSSRSMPLVGYISLLIGLALYIFWSSHAVSSPPVLTAPLLKAEAPNFSANTIDETSVSLQDYRGKVVILSFWASWCPYCKQEMPALQAAARSFPENTVQVLAVNATHQDSLVNIQQTIQTLELEYPILLDSQGEINRLYQVSALPTVFLIDPQGIIVQKWIGAGVNEAMLRTEITSITGQEIP